MFLQNPAMAAKLSQLALAANSSVENMEQGNEKERLQRIQVLTILPFTFFLSLCFSTVLALPGC
jgi:hypothetical protein